MKFDDLQAIWDTQNDKPVFAMKDARLLVALYQQREASRRRIFRQVFAPLYVVALIGLVGVGLVFVAFLMKSIHIEEIARDFRNRGLVFNHEDRDVPLLRNGRKVLN